MDGMVPLARLGLLVSALALGGCLQDFDQFSPSGGGGSGTSTTTGSQGTTTSSMMTSSSSGSGMCDPPTCDDMDPCTTDACNAGTCENTAISDGTPVPNGNLSPTDCLQPVCMNGVPVDVPLDTETPSDGNDCTTDTCANGMGVFAPLPDGTKCGAGMAFDCIAGKCGCNSPADCGPDGECGTRTCTGAAMNKTCGWDFASAGPSPNQTPGDCRERVCTGSSEIADVVADTDPQNDNNACTTDVCDGAFMTQHPAVAAGTSCGGGDECGGGNLAGTCCSPNDVCAGKDCGTLMNSCNVMKTCGMCGGGTPVCVTNQCEECGSATDCMSNPVGHACIAGNVCGCTAATQAMDCPAATPKCDVGGTSPKKNECVECTVTADCTNEVCDTNPASPTFDTCVGCTSDMDCMGTPTTPKCATVAPGIGTCVECDQPSNNSADCPTPGMKKCANHVCGA